MIQPNRSVDEFPVDPCEDQGNEAAVLRNAKWIRRGAGFTLLSALITAGGTTTALLTPESEALRYFDDPSYFVDAGILLLLALGVWRKSRFCATSVPLYFVASKVITLAETGNTSGSLVSLLFLYVFIRAAIATYSYHAQLKTADPAYRPTKWWMFVIAAPIAVLGLFALVFGMASSLQFVPQTRVVPGDELPTRIVQKMRNHGLLENDEQIQAYYSAALFSFLADGNLFTDRRVVSYALESGELFYTSALFNNVKALELERSETMFEESILFVTTVESEEFYLLLSAENDGDLEFHEELSRLCGLPR